METKNITHYFIHDDILLTIIYAYVHVTACPAVISDFRCYYNIQ